MFHVFYYNDNISISTKKKPIIHWYENGKSA